MLRGWAFSGTRDSPLIYMNYSCTRVYGWLVEADICEDFLANVRKNRYEILVCVVEEVRGLSERGAIVPIRTYDECEGSKGVLDAVNAALRREREESKRRIEYLECDKELEELISIGKDLVGEKQFRDFCKGIFGTDDLNEVKKKMRDLLRCRGSGYVPLLKARR